MRNFAKQALPWLALALAVACLGFSWNWAITRASERNQAHGAFASGAAQFIFTLCPGTPLAQAEPRWASDMRRLCEAKHPGWGTPAAQAAQTVALETNGAMETLRMLSRLALVITPSKMLSLLTLLVVSLAGLLGMQRSILDGKIRSRIRITRRTAVLMLTVVLLALSASLYLLNLEEGASTCELTSNTYANLLSIDTRCSEQTTLLRTTQEHLTQAQTLLDTRRTELDAHEAELAKLRHEIDTLGAMRDALGTFKDELQTQNASTQQLILAITGATVDSISKNLEPLQKSVKGLDQSVKTDFKDGLRSDLQGDMKGVVQNELRQVVRGELRDALQAELKPMVRDELRSLLRSELQEALKDPALLASRAHAPAPAPAAPEPKKPPELKPAIAAKPPDVKPASVVKPPDTRPASATKPPDTRPAISAKPPDARPASAAKPPAGGKAVPEVKKPPTHAVEPAHTRATVGPR